MGRQERQRQREDARLEELMQRAVRMGRSVADWENEIRNTLHVEPETRTIDFFQGVEFNNENFQRQHHVVDFVPLFMAAERSSIHNCPPAMRRHQRLDIVREGPGVWRYLSTSQAVHYRVCVHNDKRLLVEKLQDPDACVLYYAHARYGRGPCSGTGIAGYVGEDWQDGTSETTGIFRTGTRFIGIPAEEITEKGYHAHLYTGTEPPRATDCDSTLQRYHGRLARMPLSELQRRLGNVNRTHGRDIGQLVRGAGAATEVWSYLAYSHGTNLRHVVHEAGADDLRAITVRCHAFCHMGCSSGDIARQVWVRDLGMQPAGDRNLSLWTSGPSARAGYYLLYRMLADDQLSAHQAWEPWLERARDAANGDIGRDQLRYRIVSGSEAATSCGTSCARG